MEITTEVITHKLKIKGQNPMYLTRKKAQIIYNELNGKSETIIISDSEKMLYISKFKTEVELVELDSDTKTLEETLASRGLTESQKEEVRNLVKVRKEEYKTTSPGVLDNIIKSITK